MKQDVAFAFAEKYEDLAGLFNGEIPDSAIAALPANDRMMLQMLRSSQVDQRDMGNQMFSDAIKQGKVPGGTYGAKLAQLYASMEISDPNKNPAARDAFNALHDSPLSNLAYAPWLDWAPTEEQDAPPADLVLGLKRKMEQDELAFKHILSGPGMYEGRPVPVTIRGLLRTATGGVSAGEQKYFVNHDPDTDRFIITNKDGTIVRGVHAAPGDVIRSVNTLNDLYATRKKFGMWEGGADFQNRSEFQEWVTGISASTSTDDAGLGEKGDTPSTPLTPGQQSRIPQIGVEGLDPDTSVGVPGITPAGEGHIGKFMEDWGIGGVPREAVLGLVQDVFDTEVRAAKTGTQQDPIKLIYDEFGNLVEAPQSGPGSAKPLIPGRGTGIMERQGASREQQDTDPAVFLKAALNNLTADEGLRKTVYQDDTGKATIGVGHLMVPGDKKLFKDLLGIDETEFEEIKAGKGALTFRQTQQLLEHDIKTHTKKATKLLPEFESYPNNVKVAVLNGVFRGDLSGSPKTLKLIRAGKWGEAAEEYLDNAEYRRRKARGNDGVVKRMEENAQVFASMA
jgi:GH24 family phage-related lysozyme (muramidase)